MEDVGHYEFGMLHRPIQFPRLEEFIKERVPDSLDYWIAYWIATFEHLSTQQGVDFLSYEELCVSGVTGLTKLCQHLELKVTNSEVSEAASVFRRPPPTRVMNIPQIKDLSTHATELYNSLLQRCLLN